MIIPFSFYTRGEPLRLIRGSGAKIYHVYVVHIIGLRTTNTESGNKVRENSTIVENSLFK